MRASIDHLIRYLLVDKTRLISKLGLICFIVVNDFLSLASLIVMVLDV
jgi:hypothetical protein